MPSVHEPATRRPLIRVALADDHPAVTASLVAAIEAAPDLRLVAVVRDLDGALAVLARQGPDAPDVIVSDMQLAGGAEGLRLLEASSGGRPGILILSSFDTPPLVRAAFERGGAGYLAKSAEVADVLTAVRTIVGGGTVFSARMLRMVRNAPRHPSSRELEVLARVCAGDSNDEAGQALGLSEKTIESHLRRLFDRYGVMSRTELAVLAVQEGWIAGPGVA